MSNRRNPARAAAAADQLDLTRTIKKLSIPVRGSAELSTGGDIPALLLCRDSGIRKWGPRWLAQAGMRTNVPADPEQGLTIARSERPRVIVVEGKLSGSAGVPLYQELADAADVDIPVIVLSANGKEAAVAAETEVFDVARKPYAWQLISRRARYAVELAEARLKIQEHEESLSTALSLAEAARLRLRSRESFEPITGLPNKSKFLDLLRRGMAAADRDNNNLAVFVIGFNRFRLLVEAMGQEHADLVLTEVGRILNECLRGVELPRTRNPGLQTSAAASIDHFRFALMITCAGDVEQLAGLRETLLNRLSRPLEVAGQSVYLSACLGVAVYPQDAEDVDSLLQRADNAMRDAQSRGGGFKYYCAETDAAAARKLKIEHMLHEALSDQGLSLAYQPIAETGCGRVIAAEALLRWRQPDGSFISPTEFVPIAEESELMTHIGEFVIDESVRQLSAWHRAGVAVPRMCVNVSRVQLRTGRLAESLQRSLSSHNVDPSHLELEISERGVLSGDFDVLDQLHELHHIGIRLALDDFGTGDSAIAYLRRMPLDVLKIDRSYIAGIVENPKDAALTSAMVALAQRLDMTVVAEGVETQEQLKVLQEFGCDAFQGFLMSRPVPATSFVSLLNTPKKGL